MKLFIGTMLGLLVATSASAQTAASAGDARWEPFLGCWQLLDESVRNQMDLTAEEVAGGVAPAERQRRVAGSRVCVTRAGGGVTLTTFVGSQKALEETLVADGTAHPMQDADCKGSKRSEFSTIGARLYTTADITCGNQAARKVSNLAMLRSGPTWLDIQVIDISGRKNIRIKKYQRDEPTPLRTAASTFVGDVSWTVADVKEASAKLMPEVVQAALVEIDAKFRLTGKQLIELDKANVPDNVIDLMVALSYPKKFIVERPVYAGPTPYGMTSGFSYPIDYWDSYYTDGFAFWPNYYSPFAYRYWGRFDPAYEIYGGYVPIGIGGPSSPSTPVASGVGRVVDGRGYTRVTTRAPEPSRINNDGGGSNGTTSSGGGSSGGNSNNSGSSGVSSGGGYSSGGGGGDSGRTAVARPPGGN